MTRTLLGGLAVSALVLILLGLAGTELPSGAPRPEAPTPAAASEPPPTPLTREAYARRCNRDGRWTRREMDCALRRIIPSQYVARWRCIINHESRWTRTALGSHGERGLTQIHPVHRWAFARDLYDPVWNLLVARRLSNGGRSTAPWTTSTLC